MYIFIEVDGSKTKEYTTSELSESEKKLLRKLKRGYKQPDAHINEESDDNMIEVATNDNLEPSNQESDASGEEEQSITIDEEIGKVCELLDQDEVVGEGIIESKTPSFLFVEVTKVYSDKIEYQVGETAIWELNMYRILENQPVNTTNNPIQKENSIIQEHPMSYNDELSTQLKELLEKYNTMSNTVSLLQKVF